MVCKWLPIFFFGIVLIAVGFALTQIATGATIYKWVDEKGVTYYSESPPSQEKSKPIEIQTAPSTSGEKTGTAAGKTLQQEEIEFQQRRREREAAASKEEAKRQAVKIAESEMRRKCAEAKARIALLQKQRRGPAPTRNEKGELEWWNFEQRGIEINFLGRFIDQNCPPG
jgi:hypothetical protein